MTDFNFDTALTIFQLNDEFPIDFDDAWQWLGWNKKQDGKTLLFNNFDEGIDFLRKGVKSSTGGRPSEWLVITIDCFKSMGMMVGTELGKQIRKYFIQCEKVAVSVKTQQQKLTTNQPDAIKQLETYSKVIDIISSGVHIDPSLWASVKLDHAKTLMPECSEGFENARQLLINSTANTSALLTVTAVGKQLNLSGRKVNSLLIDNGYQLKNVERKSKKDPDYIPTELGKPFCRVVQATGKGEYSTYQQLRWYDSIVNELNSLN